MLRKLSLHRLKHPRLLLRSIWLRNRKKLPREPGIYILISFWEVVYVGMSSNLNSRWNSTGFYTHHKLSKARLLPLPRLYYLPLPGCSERQLLSLELETKHHFKAKNQAQWNDVREVSGKLIFDLYADLGLIILATVLSILFARLIPVWLIVLGVYFWFEGKTK